MTAKRSPATVSSGFVRRPRVFRMHPVDQPVGFKEDLSIFRDTKRAQLVYVRAAVRKRFERISRLDESLEDILARSKPNPRS